MGQLLLKALIAGAIVAGSSELAKRYPAVGGLLVSLPITSILSMIFLWQATEDPIRVAGLATSTIWFIVPSLALLVIVPLLLRNHVGFWPALGLGCVVTASLYAGAGWIADKIGFLH